MLKLGVSNWNSLADVFKFYCHDLQIFVQQLAKHFHHHDGFLGAQTKVLGHNKFCTVLTKNVA